MSAGRCRPGRRGVQLRRGGSRVVLLTGAQVAGDVHHRAADGATGPPPRTDKLQRLVDGGNGREAGRSVAGSGRRTDGRSGVERGARSSLRRPAYFPHHRPAHEIMPLSSTATTSPPSRPTDATVRRASTPAAALPTPAIHRPGSARQHRLLHLPHHHVSGSDVRRSRGAAQRQRRRVGGDPSRQPLVGHPAEG